MRPAPRKARTPRAANPQAAIGLPASSVQHIIVAARAFCAEPLGCGPEPHKPNSRIPMSHREAKGRASRVEPPTGSLSFVARSIRSSVRIWRSLRSNASNCSRTTLSSIPSSADRLVLSVIYAPRNNFVILQEKRHTLAKTGLFRCPEPTRGLTVIAQMQDGRPRHASHVPRHHLHSRRRSCLYVPRCPGEDDRATA